MEDTQLTETPKAPRTFKIYKRLDLSFLGEEWKNCYINFRPVSPLEVMEMSELPDPKEQKGAAYKYGLEMAVSHFVNGTAITEGGEVDMEADDLRTIDRLVLDEASKLLMGVVDPNSQRPSTPSSSADTPSA